MENFETKFEADCTEMRQMIERTQGKVEDTIRRAKPRGWRREDLNPIIDNIEKIAIERVERSIRKCTVSTNTTEQSK